MSEETKWIERRTWTEFRDSGLLWFVNRILHFFGWAIACEMEEEDKTKVREAYPSRCRYRGFDDESATRGFKKLTTWVKDNIDDFGQDVDL